MFISVMVFYRRVRETRLKVFVRLIKYVYIFLFFKRNVLIRFRYVKMWFTGDFFFLKSVWVCW